MGGHVQTRRSGAVALSVLVSAVLLPIVTGLASSAVPDALRPYLWLAWPLTGILATFAIASEMRRRRPLHPASATGIIIDPAGPEEAAQEAATAYRQQQFSGAFRKSVVAIDRLHDLYIFENFRNRQPSLNDAWIVNGMTSALGAARALDPVLDVRSGVREVTHRLKDIARAVEDNGGDATLYRNALAQLSLYAPDVDVSDVF